MVFNASSLPDHSKALRQFIGDVVTIALFADENVDPRCVPVGLSNAPMATPVQSFWIGSQKGDAPQVLQKPRTFSEE